jgi:hypothetical protein
MTDREYVYQVIDGDIAGDREELLSILATLDPCSPCWLDCLIALDKATERANAEQYLASIFASSR